MAANGVDALAPWRCQPSDLIYMDIQMSGPDGYEAARRIRVQERVRGGHARFIAMTSHAMSGDRERYLDAGMGDHVSKPVRRKALELSIAQPPWLPSFCNTEQMS